MEALSPKRQRGNVNTKKPSSIVDLSPQTFVGPLILGVDVFTERVKNMKPAEKVLYVAELSANHNQSLDRALDIIERVASSGASAVKLQTYKPETMTLPLTSEGFLVSGNNNPWGGMSLFSLYADAMTPWDWHKPLFGRIMELGMIPFSSPFDNSAVDFLENLDCPIYKIASFELVDLGLISYAASTGKPLIISTGMGSIQEIADAVDAALKGGCDDLTLLKTTSSYPASPKHSNLMTMVEMAKMFDVKVGISDHTLGIGASIAAVTLGASVVEKHVTLNRSDGGVDSEFSMEPKEFGDLVIEAEVARESVGKINFGPTLGDEASLAFRRSIYVSQKVYAGERVSADNVRAIRPGFGMPIKMLSFVTGMTFSADYDAGTPLTFDCLK
jgi:N-acetylneuraminate synthase